jgi:hypothetical protein
VSVATISFFMLKSIFLLSAALLLVAGIAMAQEKPAADAING